MFQEVKTSLPFATASKCASVLSWRMACAAASWGATGALSAALVLQANPERRNESREDPNSACAGRKAVSITNFMSSAPPTRVCFQAVANPAAEGQLWSAATTAKAWVKGKWDWLQSEVSFSSSTVSHTLGECALGRIQIFIVQHTVPHFPKQKNIKLFK